MINLHSHTLHAHPHGATMQAILHAALAAADPYAAVRRTLWHDGATLHVGARALDLRAIDRLLLLAIGKAAAAMATAAHDVLGDRISAGLVVAKDPPPVALPAPLALLLGAHPVPDARSVAAAIAARDLLHTAGEHDLVLALVSGGGSALLTAPHAPLTLADLARLTQLLLASGATIDEINCVRKHLDAVKGGGLARAAAPATSCVLVLSDVVGSPLDVIASGPFVADPTSCRDALAVLDRYQLRAAVPRVVALLERGTTETLNAGDPLLARGSCTIIGDGAQAAHAAAAAARVAGLHAEVFSTALVGEARVAGRTLAARAHQVLAAGAPRPCCLVASGETTVTLGDAPGRGGRNQELALAAAPHLPDGALLVALATDGGDGPTDAAGAVATHTTWQRARARGLDPQQHLDGHDAYPLFMALEDLLLPGPTGTNVNDITVVIIP